MKTKINTIFVFEEPEFLSKLGIKKGRIKFMDYDHDWKTNITTINIEITEEEER